MKTRLVFIVLVCFFLTSVLSCLFPSVLSVNPSLYMSAQAEQNLNDAYEEEPLNVDIDVSQVFPEKLNWFTTVINIFEKFTNARVVDCLTKKEYNVQRVGGYNHADVECLTQQDANILKSLYGGVWSWARRAVWVEVDEGVWVAGSINGMPHSYSYFTDNGEDGHTCIHFYMSKTHGTKRVDEAHQECVQYAYEHANELKDYLKQRYNNKKQ